jgi:hypothetical protein
MTGTTLSSAAAPPQSVPSVASPSVTEADGLSAHTSASDPPQAGKRSRLLDDPQLPAFLVSLIVHTLLLVMLALFTYRGTIGATRRITARQGDPAAVVSLQLLDQKDGKQFTDGALTEQPVTVTIAPTEPLTIPSPLQTTDVSQVDPSLSGLPQSGSVSATRAALLRLPGGGLSGRSLRPRRGPELRRDAVQTTKGP